MVSCCPHNLHPNSVFFEVFVGAALYHADGKAELEVCPSGATWRHSHRNWHARPQPHRYFHRVDLKTIALQRSLLDQVLAASKAPENIKISYSGGPGPEQAKTTDFRREMAVRTPPGIPPGEGAKNTLKNRPEHN